MPNRVPPDAATNPSRRVTAAEFRDRLGVGDDLARLASEARTTPALSGAARGAILKTLSRHDAPEGAAAHTAVRYRSETQH